MVITQVYRVCGGSGAAGPRELFFFAGFETAKLFQNQRKRSVFDGAKPRQAPPLSNYNLVGFTPWPSKFKVAS